jgi:hypothetical protein
LQRKREEEEEEDKYRDFLLVYLFLIKPINDFSFIKRDIHTSKQHETVRDQAT